MVLSGWLIEFELFGDLSRRSEIVFFVVARSCEGGLEDLDSF